MKGKRVNMHMISYVSDVMIAPHMIKRNDQHRERGAD